jgi:hypothetical protein
MANSKILSLGLALAIMSLTSIQISGSERRTIKSQRQPQSIQNSGFSFGSGGFSQAQPAPANSAFSFGSGFSTTAQPQPAQTGTSFVSSSGFSTAPQTQPAPAISGSSFGTSAPPRFQPPQESTETIKMLADKITALDQAIKAIQIDLTTLKEIVMRDHSTSIRMLNEAIENKNVYSPFYNKDKAHEKRKFHTSHHYRFTRMRIAFVISGNASRERKDDASV